MINRIVKLQDLLVTGGLFLFGLISAIVALYTPQKWDVGMIVSLSCAVCGFGFVFILFLRKLIFGKPTYITKEGAYVWENKTGIDKSKCEEALEFFIVTLSTLCTGISESILRKMLAKTNIILSLNPIESIGKSYYLKNNAGLQLGYNLGVHISNGCIKGTAFFHELMHETQFAVLGLAIDYNHTDTSLWAICSQIEEAWNQRS